MTKKILHLTLKRKYFDAIAEGRKKTEYRKLSEYWKKRFTKPSKFTRHQLMDIMRFDEVWFRNGYNPKNPFMRVEWLRLNLEKFEGEFCFAIRLGKVLEIRNWKGRGTR